MAGSLVRGHKSEELRRDHLATWLKRKPAVGLPSHSEAFSPLGTSYLVWLWGASVPESGVKSSVGASETGQGWTPESHRGLVSRFCFLSTNIFTRS